MPNLYPGINPSLGSGRPYVLSLLILFLPFFIFAQPVITGFNPQSGAAGSTVTISGSNFGSTPGTNIVYFGAVQATVTAASATSLTVTVPAGTSYQPLTVTTGGLTAASAAPFITTFNDPGQFIPTAFSTRQDIRTGNGPQSIFSMDMDGDGKPDLIVADGDSNTVEIYRNTSTPYKISFALAVDYILPSNYYPIAITAGDLDGDGRPEVVVSDYGSPKLGVFQNISTPGNIAIGTPTFYALGNYTTGVTIADCTGDGKPEIVVCSAASNVISVFANNSTVGNLNFSPKKDLTALPVGTLPWNVVVADFDGDGKSDIASVNSGVNTVSVFLNTGTAGGPVSFAANVDFSVGGSPQDLKAGDLDGDGKPDIVVVNNGDATITLLQNACTPGHVNFNRGTDVPTGTSNPGSPWALAMADYDGDGKPDIASINQLDNTVSIHRNTSTAGSPAISANLDYATGDVPWAITTADYDGDGMPDLAIIDNTTSKITLLRDKSSLEPSITSFTPTAGVAGTVVTIVGAHFTGTTSVSFGSVAAASFTVVSADTVTATLGNGATGIITLVTPNGPAFSADTFKYGVPPPTITGFTPDSASPGTTITIKGTHFTGASLVTFGNTPAASFTVVSDSVLTAVVGNGISGSVLVKTASDTASRPGFTYIPPPISISSFSPQSGTQGAHILIRGNGFSTNPTVSFGGVAATIFSVYGDTSIIAVVAAGATGNVTVSGSNGTDSKAGFTYTTPSTPPPSNLITITSFSPTSAARGDTVYIHGTQLTTANSITFGGTPALFYKAMSDSQLLVVLGAGATGQVKVTNNTSSDSLSGFVYLYDSTKLQTGAFQLLQFSGALAGNSDAQLQWQVRNDAGIAFYAVERGSDSTLFTVISMVKSTRSNGASHVYTFSDPVSVNGTSWYRLKMQDTTAAYTYSSPVKIMPVGQPVHPNPVKYGFFYVDLPDISSTWHIRLYDMSGKVLKVVEVAPGTSEVRINIPGLASGTYQLQWTNGKSRASETILVLGP